MLRTPVSLKYLYVFNTYLSISNNVHYQSFRCKTHYYSPTKYKTMITKNNAAFVKTEGYGLTGCKITLNLAQCQKLSSLHSKLMDINKPFEKARVLTDVESEMLLFLSLFKEFTNPDSADLWANLVQEENYQNKIIKEEDTLFPIG